MPATAGRLLLPRFAFHLRRIRPGMKTAAETQPERPVLRTLNDSHVFRIELRGFWQRDKLGPCDSLQWTGTHWQAATRDLSQKSSVEAHASL